MLILIIISGCKVEHNVKEEVTVGAMLPLTGPASFLGGLMYKGVELADEQAEGLRVIYEDCPGDQKIAMNAYQMLAEIRDVDVLISALTPVSQVVAPLAEENQIPLLMTAVSLDYLEDGRDYVFRDFTTAKQDASISGRYAKNELNAETAAVMYLLNDFGQSYADHFEESFEGEVKFFGFEMADRDFRTQLFKIKESGFDVFYVIGYESHIINIVKEAKELNIDTTFMTNWVVASPLIIEMAQGAVDGIYITTPEFYLNDGGYVKKFKQDFFNKYGHYPDAYSALAYDAVMMIERSLPNIKSGLSEITGYQSLMGEMTVDEDGEMSFPLQMAKVVDGEIVVLD